MGALRLGSVGGGLRSVGLGSSLSRATQAAIRWIGRVLLCSPSGPSGPWYAFRGCYWDSRLFGIMCCGVLPGFVLLVLLSPPASDSNRVSLEEVVVRCLLGGALSRGGGPALDDRSALAERVGEW